MTVYFFPAPVFDQRQRELGVVVLVARVLGGQRDPVRHRRLPRRVPSHLQLDEGRQEVAADRPRLRHRQDDSQGRKVSRTQC